MKNPLLFYRQTAWRIEPSFFDAAAINADRDRFGAPLTDARSVVAPHDPAACVHGQPRPKIVALESRSVLILNPGTEGPCCGQFFAPELNE